MLAVALRGTGVWFLCKKKFICMIALHLSLSLSLCVCVCVCTAQEPKPTEVLLMHFRWHGR